MLEICLWETYHRLFGKLYYVVLLLSYEAEAPNQRRYARCAFVMHNLMMPLYAARMLLSVQRSNWCIKGWGAAGFKSNQAKAHLIQLIWSADLSLHSWLVVFGVLLLCRNENLQPLGPITNQFDTYVHYCAVTKGVGSRAHFVNAWGWGKIIATGPTITRFRHCKLVMVVCNFTALKEMVWRWSPWIIIAFGKSIVLTISGTISYWGSLVHHRSLWTIVSRWNFMRYHENANILHIPCNLQR